MSYITTYTGLHVDPVQPTLDSFDIRDIAHALSLTCRGNGHVQSFFSVAQHCINCALEANKRGYPTRLTLACLLHDASEAYMSDVPRPFKGLLKDYLSLESKLLDMIYVKYLGSTLTADEQKLLKAIDDDMLYFDLKYLLLETPAIAEPQIHIDLSYDFVPFDLIEAEYLNLYNRFSQALFKE